MRRVTYAIEFLTPAFIGGSDPKKAELTANGIRGHLRWWFRFMAGGRLTGDLELVHKAEKRLFGATDHHSALRVVVTKQPETSLQSLKTDGLSGAEIVRFAGAPSSRTSSLVILKNGKEVDTQPLAYLGFGPLHFDGSVTRHYLAPGRAEFFIQYGRVQPADAAILHDAIWAWMNLGAIGSRSRRGFGSFVCKGVRVSGGDEDPDAVMTAAADAETFEQSCRAVFARNLTPSAALPEWSHLSSDTVVFRAAQGAGDWQTAMTTAAAWLIAFRRRYGMGAGTDYDWYKAPRAGGIPHRAGFGLPLPFGKKEFVTNWRGNRRTSPLLVRIARFGTRFYPIFTYVPARFLPAREQIRFHQAAGLPGPQHAAIVPQFLTELTARGKTVKVV